MFGFSPTKILFTAAIILVIWYGFKWVGRLSEAKERDEAQAAKSKDGGKSENAKEAVELIACKVCGDYISSDKKVSCGRDDCPYPG